MWGEEAFLVFVKWLILLNIPERWSWEPRRVVLR